MAILDEEQVLVISEEHFRKVGYFEGFLRTEADYDKALLDPSAFRFLPRSKAEVDPSYKQIIPYCVLNSGDQFFRYRRSPSGGEKRLESLYSIGIGGHINPGDLGENDDPSAIYINGMQRELNEEVEIGEIISGLLMGFIYDPSLAVGRVHLGVVHLISLEKPIVSMKEDKLSDGRFESLRSLIENRKPFETWSQLILDAMAKG